MSQAAGAKVAVLFRTLYSVSEISYAKYSVMRIVAMCSVGYPEGKVVRPRMKAGDGVDLESTFRRHSSGRGRTADQPQPQTTIFSEDRQ